uniref:Uncharacterized protein n=1 Tax=Anguilla anguilla TaxID=7936 RepID=A0A0E9W9I2_ANGAN
MFGPHLSDERVIVIDCCAEDLCVGTLKLLKSLHWVPHCNTAEPSLSCRGGSPNGTQFSRWGPAAFTVQGSSAPSFGWT